MEVRDAVEADAGRLAELTDAPRDVMRNLIHDRTVRVAESDEELSGFVSFDARERTVHVTQLEGSTEACTRLIEEPMGFAAGEGMAVELLVPESNDTVRQAVEE
ncbi:MAG: hypothetical protein ACOCPX_03845, partial [Halapricum sp.]